ncbi:cytochrome P450 [Auriscalpium vulgare]|uniref:Cytochrome P450 n=1 Tax=Auriscalpium vulgare TaxID=40419 RepID=A0ACB8S0W7_9AGAM|nr:cytochrome P450 [Auriscalpium vulgare]
MGFKGLARRGHDIGEASIIGPWNRFKEAAERGESPDCIALHELREHQQLDSSEKEESHRGVSTTTRSLRAFFLMLARYPAIQERAHAEVDAVTGGTRLPSFEDRPKLPYVNALCKEVLRWRMVAPSGIPHASMEDDVYDGYFIPKGSMIIANAWAMLHNPAVYPAPETFNPERHLTADGDAAFGFGKRICPGRFIAESVIFITAAMVLSTFSVGRPKGVSEEACIDGNVNVGHIIAAMAEKLILSAASNQ